MNLLKNKNTSIRQQSALECVPNAPNPRNPRARASHTVTTGEKTLEMKLRKAIEQRGGMAVKLTSQLHRGLPDRLILMPEGLSFFAEVKTTGKQPTKLQVSVHRDLRKLGFQVFVVDSLTSLERTVNLIDVAIMAKRIQNEGNKL